MINLLQKARGLMGLALTHAEFRDCVADAIRRRHPAASVARVGGDEIRVVWPSGEDSVLHLSRAYEVHRAAPRNLPVLLDELLSMLGPVEIAAADELVVLARPFTLGADQPDPGQLRRQLVGDLAVVVALDKPESYVYPPAEELRDGLNLDDDALWERALRNTRERLGVEPVPLVPEQVLLIQTDDGLASGLLALDAFWDSPELTAFGPLAVAAPYQSEVHIAPLSDAQAVERLRKVLAEAAGPFFLSDALLVRHGGGWKAA
jgi:hypothetical protein